MVKNKNIYVIVRHDNYGSYPVCCASNYKTAQKLLKVKRLRFPNQHWTIDVLDYLWTMADNVALDERINHLKKYEK